MTEHDPKYEERVEDLDVSESESEEIKGGIFKFSKFDLSASSQIANNHDQIFPGPGTRLGDGSV